MNATASPTPWFERDPARLQWELDEFARHALEIEVSEDDERRLLVRIVRGLVFRGEPVGANVLFSHGHPYFEPTVTGDARLLDRHQDPVGLNYCLLEDSDEDWHPSRSAGQLIGKNLRHLLADSAAGADRIRAGEANMAEPASSQFRYVRPPLVLVPEPFLASELTACGGEMTLAHGDATRLRVLVGAAGIGTADPELVSRVIPGAGTIAGRWIALDDVVPEREPAAGLLAAAFAVDGTLDRRMRRVLKEHKRLPSVTAQLGITFIEQGPTRNETRRTWVFAEVLQERGGQPQVTAFIPAQALTRTERQRRIPELAGLADVGVAVIGAGSVGAPVALELAKAGVARLEIVDFDIYDVNNTVRHVLDATEAGNEKTGALGDRCRSINPFIDVRVHQTQLGRWLPEEDLLDELTSSASVIVDTTGSQALARLLSDRCRSAGATLVVAGLTAEAFGGEIFVIDDGPCLDCFIGAQAAGEGELPKPPEGERSIVTPMGCRHPAFTGAGFEATELAAITARTAVRATGATTYPPLEVNWIILDFRGGDHYREGRIGVQPDCRAHNEAS